ncbi:MAG TPA: pentapeptide repeat-containing protein [Methylobacterium sp.]|uniref:pentapeptide repeat-containing protein n=1 Tax=Methylorubrum sp. B1-46 TaxID=2897334 RepID=UPI001E2B17CE|nr:pentapeptide repeat-containing protein [Methylorubrum sp. B1-46]UGB25442.1 pentapeptide repeat-containing protein [Methylorubrum sp. B1-46]HEV2543285.1 pentapeptide repeat-containing protein [Methylobacterium sp.]
MRDGGAEDGDPRVTALLAHLAEREAPFSISGRDDLAGLALGRDALTPSVDPQAPPPWWVEGSGGLDLAGADLADARLEETDLSGANLRRVSLAGALARSADFAGACVEEADFSGADLSGARFTGIAGGQASFREAMIEDADFSGATMRFARLDKALLDGARFEGADLWGTDFTGADADDSVFRKARLDEANLSDCNLTGADFEGASLKKARLVGSRLRGANFSGARLDGADLSGADFSRTSLVRLDLTACRLHHARFAGAWLEGVRLSVEQIGGMVGEEKAGEYEAAQASYLALERNLQSIGSPEGASWAYKRGRRMGRRHAGQRAREAFFARDIRGTLSHGYRWIADRFVEWLCDYGESLSRIARAFLVGIVLFAGAYGATGGLFHEGENIPTYNPLDLVSYSALNMMTANPPEIGVKPIGRVTNLLVGLQGAAGIVLMGLFGFVLGNRLRR